MADQIPTTGSVCSFRTAPFSEFGLPTTGRYAAFKVLGSNESHIVIAVLNSIWQSPPSLDDVQRCEILREHRFSHSGRLAVCGINSERWSLSDLDDLKVLGDVPLNTEELQLAVNIFNYAPGTVYAGMCFANYTAEGEWRWANDRDALIDEQQREIAKVAAKREAEAARYKERLRGLTWDQLLQETPFESWSPSPPFPSATFTRAAREVIHNTCRALQSLGANPRKADVRKLLKECVKWFNWADEEAEGAIETEEREDICDVLEDMAHVAKQKSLIDEVDRWRTW